MEFNLKKYRNELLFVPVGGTDEIGLNLYLYQYKGKWLVVDMGLGFADDYFPGVDILVPDITFLQMIKKDILGLVITHAHEDHIGAIQYIWGDIGAPIYTSPFTAAVLKSKLSESGQSNKYEINELKLGKRLNIGDFDIEFIPLTHSVPEMQSLAIRTDQGVVFHTGDWKFDDNPVIGKPSNKDKIKALGDEGVLLMTCDSTNIFSEGRAGSEGELQKSLGKIISRFKHPLVVVTTFASNIARVQSIMEAAKKAKRKVMLSGTSLWRMYHAAVDAGYMTEYDAPIHPKQFSKHKRSELLVIATGCQGEPLATTSKLARGEHPDIKLNKSDIVIFSSKIIPGNELKIFDLFNKFCRSGVEVMTEKDHFVHVSGHPNRDEVEEMYNLVRPKYCIPMHGEPMHLHEHWHFVTDKKLSTPLQISNGNVAKITKSGVEIVGQVPTGYMAIDGNFILPSDSEILRMRRRMRDQGIVIVSLAYSKKGLASAPAIIAPGVLDSQEDVELYKMLNDELMRYLETANIKMQNEVETRVRGICKRFIKQETGKEPKILLQFIKVA